MEIERPTLYASNINSTEELVTAYTNQDLVPYDLNSMTQFIHSSLQHTGRILQGMDHDLKKQLTHRGRVTIRGHRGGFSGTMGTHS